MGYIHRIYSEKYFIKKNKPKTDIIFFKSRLYPSILKFSTILYTVMLQIQLKFNVN